MASKPRKHARPPAGMPAGRHAARTGTGAALTRAETVARGPVGMAAGAAVGSSLGRGKKARPGRGRARQLLVAEFVACIIVLAFSPLAGKHEDESAGAWMKRGTAVCLLFLVLGMVATAGPGAGKIAAGFGALVTAGILMNNMLLFQLMAEKFVPEPAPTP